MLINPSPTTPLATRGSGRGAGRAGQGRAGLGARCPRASAQPSCSSTAGPAVAPARARSGSSTAGQCQNLPWHSGRVPAAAWPGQAPGLLGSEPAPRGEPWGCRGAAVRSHRLCSARAGPRVGSASAPAQALSPSPVSLLPSKCASYYGDVASLAQEELNEVHLCRITLSAAADPDTRDTGGGTGGLHLLLLVPTATASPAPGSGWPQSEPKEWTWPHGGLVALP